MTTAKIQIPDKLVDVFTGEADVRGAYGGRGSGKCLGRGTMLLRADASLVAVEDVKVGDLLLGPDGAPRTVLSLAAGIGPLYKVTQKTGMSYVCNDAHILVLERSQHARTDYGSISAAGNRQRPGGRYAGYDSGHGYSLITAAELAKKPGRFKAQHFGFRRAVIGEPKALPIDPYLLGVWLGDGAENAPTITNVDAELIEWLERVCELNGWKFTAIACKAGRAGQFYLGNKFTREGSFMGQLRAAGVLGKKHIPEAYFGASLEQRRALLAGLIDTDGCVSNGCIEISQARELLADQIMRLAHGLGLKCSKREQFNTCNKKRCRSFRLQIGGNIDTLPLLINRKREAALAVRKNKDWRRTRIDVEPIGDGEYFGFELDGDRLFMLADGTVTHNTMTFAKMTAIRALMWDQAGREGAIVCGREYLNSIDDSSLAEVKAAIESEPELLRPHFEIGEKYIRTRSRRISYKFSGMDKKTIMSLKSKAKILLLWADEAEPITDKAWDIVVPTLRQEDSELWVTWNPARKASATDRRFRQTKDPRFKVVEMNWRDNPWFPAILERQRLRWLANDPDGYDHVWEGAYATAVKGAYFTKQLSALKREGRYCRVGADPLMKRRLFVDIGGTGRNADAFTMWGAQFVGREVRVLNYYEQVGQEIGHHLQWMRRKGYLPENAEIFLPHDGATHDKVFDVSYQSAFEAAGYSVTVVPNQGRGAAISRINAARRIFPSVWINLETPQAERTDEDGQEHEPTTEDGLAALGWYHEKWDDERDIGLGPEHDWASHASDSFGLMAVVAEDHFRSGSGVRKDGSESWRRRRSGMAV